MTDHMKPMTAGWHKRQRVHRHNGYTGHARMMQMQLRNIEASDSVSEGTKYVARQMLGLVDLLAEGLKTRIDP